MEIVVENRDSLAGTVLVPSKSLSGFARGYILDTQGVDYFETRAMKSF